MIRSIVLTIVVMFVFVMGMDGYFVVYEGEQAIVTEFGKPVGQTARPPGLYFKMPFIQEIRRFESRIIKWDGDPKEIPTLDKRFIFVDSTARWRITDPLKFYTRVNDLRGALTRLDDIIDAAVRNAVSSHLLVELVRHSGYTPSEEASMADEDAESVKTGSIRGRDEILESVRVEAAKKIEEYGVQLIDVQIKRINLAPKVQHRVFERMVNERRKAAAEFRSEGEGEKAEILGQMNKELKRIESTAYRQAIEIRGRADAEAAAIYAKAFSKDVEFFSLYRTLESYRKGIFDKGRLVIGTDAEYFQLLKSFH